MMVLTSVHSCVCFLHISSDSLMEDGELLLHQLKNGSGMCFQYAERQMEKSGAKADDKYPPLMTK